LTGCSASRARRPQPHPAQSQPPQPHSLPTPTPTAPPPQISALPPFDLKRALTGLLSPSETWATLKDAAWAARTWLGADPWGALKAAAAQRTLATLDAGAWARVIATNQLPTPDIHPGKFRRSELSPAQWLM
jgi:hypothetical protein